MPPSGTATPGCVSPPVVLPMMSVHLLDFQPCYICSNEFHGCRRFRDRVTKIREIRRLRPRAPASSARDCADRPSAWHRSHARGISGSGNGPSLVEANDVSASGKAADPVSGCHAIRSSFSCAPPPNRQIASSGISSLHQRMSARAFTVATLAASLATIS